MRVLRCFCQYLRNLHLNFLCLSLDDFLRYFGEVIILGRIAEYLYGHIVCKLIERLNLLFYLDWLVSLDLDNASFEAYVRRVWSVDIGSVSTVVLVERNYSPNSDILLQS